MLTQQSDKGKNVSAHHLSENQPISKFKIMPSQDDMTLISFDFLFSFFGHIFS